MASLFKNTHTIGYPWLKTFDKVVDYTIVNTIENKNPLIKYTLALPTVFIVGIQGLFIPLLVALHYMEKGYFNLLEYITYKERLHILHIFWLLPFTLVIAILEVTYFGPLNLYCYFKRRRQRKSGDEVIRVRPLGEPSGQLFYVDFVYEYKREKSIEPIKNISKHKFK